MILEDCRVFHFTEWLSKIGTKLSSLWKIWHKASESIKYIGNQSPSAQDWGEVSLTWMGSGSHHRWLDWCLAKHILGLKMTICFGPGDNTPEKVIQNADEDFCTDIHWYTEKQNRAKAGQSLYPIWLQEPHQAHLTFFERMLGSWWEGGMVSWSGIIHEALSGKHAKFKWLCMKGEKYTVILVILRSLDHGELLL